MKIARSSFYREPVPRLADADLPDAIRAICDEFEAYGWRRVRATDTLRHAIQQGRRDR